MQLFHLIAATVIITACAACSNSSNSTKAELEASRQAGRKQAEYALSQPKNSLAREKAVFAIRARETRLRDAGYLDCADAYIAAADSVLHSAPLD